jgi:hypothetical protein
MSTTTLLILVVFGGIVLWLLDKRAGNYLPFHDYPPDSDPVDSDPTLAPNDRVLLKLMPILAGLVLIGGFVLLSRACASLGLSN